VEAGKLDAMSCVLFLNSRRLIHVVDKTLVDKGIKRSFYNFLRSFYALTRVPAGVWFVLHFGDLHNYGMLGT
jgi:hypothetical protein